ncbi:MAG TPA: ABC transporter ATP-binding protein [Stellaceae bacterium]|nr:ABC transporter ATP-binding protein [Stellaceae bacterium]
MSLEIAGLAKAFGTVRAVDGVSLSVASGEFFTLLGPSGCGKTTLLRLVAGIYPASSGSVRLNGRDITHAPMHTRNLAMVFQSFALFPHLSVFDNVAFGLRSRGVAREEIRARVKEALALVKLEALAERFPAELSGGQQQRVALARALVVRPDLLLFDEPLSNLDARLRDEMRFEIRDLQRRIGITTVLVTHDIEEAFVMSDRMAVMRAGKIEQIGRAEEIYRSPASRFVANFVGPINELALSGIETVGGRRKALAAGSLPVWLPDGGSSGSGKATLILRPEALRVGSGEIAADNRFQAEVVDVVYLGGSSECRLKIGSLLLAAVLPSAAAQRLRPRERVTVGWDANDGVMLDAG